MALDGRAPVAVDRGDIHRRSSHSEIRSTVEEIAEWTETAKEERKLPSVWARDELNAAAKRARSKRKP